MWYSYAHARRLRCLRCTAIANLEPNPNPNQVSPTPTLNLDQVSILVLEVLTLDRYTDACPVYVAGIAAPLNIPSGAKASFGATL